MGKIPIKGIRGLKSIKNFIKTAFEPVGKVMYIYGGGWNETDSGAGREAMTLGLSESWLMFSEKQNSTYNYKDYDYIKDKNVIHNGLDCSGYIGWVIHNVLNDETGYVGISYKTGGILAERGLGTVIKREDIALCRAGDIMFGRSSMVRHVFICLGQCSDKSMLILHSSPPGVQLNGTYTPEGNINSYAVRIARGFMREYYPEWYEKFPDVSRNTSYLTDYDCFRWNVLDDNENYRNMLPEKILNDIKTGN